MFGYKLVKEEELRKFGCYLSQARCALKVAREHMSESDDKFVKYALEHHLEWGENDYLRTEYACLMSLLLDESENWSWTK